MEFKEFFQLLWSNLAINDQKKISAGKSNFLLSITDELLREPQTNEEDTQDKDGELNPLRGSDASLVSRYCSGQRNIPKKVAVEFLQKQGKGLELKKEISFTTSEAQDAIYEGLKRQGFVIRKSQLADFCYKLFFQFFKKFSEGKNCVIPEDMIDKQQEQDAFQLVNDYEQQCPLCGEKLLRNVEGKTVTNYEIVHLYPDNLDELVLTEFQKIKKAPADADAINNKISLCVSCANEYKQMPTLQKYNTLVNRQTKVIRDKMVDQELHGISLESQLSTIIRGMAELEVDDDQEQISYDAIKVSDKIPNNKILQRKVRYDVSLYYHKIREKFSEIEDQNFMFELLAQHIKSAYKAFKIVGYHQETIFNEMTKWILEKEHLTEDYTEAARIIVAFFVANCEVFESEDAK